MNLFHTHLQSLFALLSVTQGLRKLTPYFFLILLPLSGCTSAYKKSVGADRDVVISRVYVADFNTAWQAVLESVKSQRLDVSDRDAGIVQTRWKKNTAEKNFTDANGGVLPYTLAQVRFRITFMRGFVRGLPAIKINVQKEQIVQRDALDELRPQESDGVEEKTLMYRVGRILRIKLSLAQAEEARTRSEMQNSEFNDGSLGTPTDDNGMGSSPDLKSDVVPETESVPTVEDGSFQSSEEPEL